MIHPAYAEVVSQRNVIIKTFLVLIYSQKKSYNVCW